MGVIIAIVIVYLIIDMKIDISGAIKDKIHKK